MSFHQFYEKGHQLVEHVFSDQEIGEILKALDTAGVAKAFGVREILFNHPELREKVFTKSLNALISKVLPDGKYLIKSIYFDKPPHANWIVNWHQDLTINIKNKKEQPGYKNWRVNQDRVVVQPAIQLLENIVTIRIHLDDCNAQNGALRIIEDSHRKGVIPIKDWIKNQEGQELVCEAPKGSVLLMRPLLLHASRRTENATQRRVLYLEFTDQDLPDGLDWKESVPLKS
ncbi:MAG: phytanoyl-CoA dioxygenase family protein [Bacteroidota bacterium]